MVRIIPEMAFLTSGVGRHKNELMSFEMALKDAGVHSYNIVPVSSILPASCKIVSYEEGIAHLVPGEVVFCVLSRNSSNIRDERVLASIGCAVSNNPSLNGYIYEYHSDEDEAEGLIRSKSLATELYEMANDESPKEVMGASKGATVEADGIWTTVVAMMVFVT